MITESLYDTNILNIPPPMTIGTSLYFPHIKEAAYTYLGFVA
jgi:hypothetical protein